MATPIATTEVQICNLALSHLGVARRIASLSEQSAEAMACNLVYAKCRHAALSFPWKFATRRAVLEEVDGIDVPTPWQKAFIAPADMLLAQSIWPGARAVRAEQRVPFSVETVAVNQAGPFKKTAIVAATDYAEDLTFTLSGTPTALFDCTIAVVQRYKIIGAVGGNPVWGVAAQLNFNIRTPASEIGNEYALTVVKYIDPLNTALPLNLGANVDPVLDGLSITGISAENPSFFDTGTNGDNGDLFNSAWTFSSYSNASSALRQIVCCDNDAPELVYIADITDPGFYPAYFIDVLTWCLATEIAMPLTKDPNLEQFCQARFAKAIAMAGATSFQEGQEDQPADSSIFAARL